MTTEASSSADDGDHHGVEVRILEARAVDEMVGKIQAAATLPGAGEAVEAWRAAHGDEAWMDRGHDHAVVGQTLMYLHDAPDGMLVPHARYPDGTEKVYTDALHAETAF
jgi:hypothetical protein